MMKSCGLIPTLVGLMCVFAGVPGVRAQDQPAPAEEKKPPNQPTPKPVEPEEKPPGPEGEVKPAWRDTGTELVVYLKDGKSLTGLLVRESREEVVIRISGIETPINRSMIDRYQVLPPILERYRQYRESIGNDPDQVLMLVSWLQAREQFELALDEIARLLEKDPHNKQAMAMRKAIQSQMELRDASRSRAKENRVAEGSESAKRPGARAAPEPFPLLSDAQISLIKVFEIDLDDPPRILIQRETIAKMLERYAGSALLPATQEGRDALYRKPSIEVLDLMFRLKARELYGEVQVLDHPRSMRMFRDDVQAAWLVNSCATNACHGGTEAGRLMLLNRKPRSEASVYTNFLILERFRLDDGAPLLNYEDPARSPLLQMALPREVSRYRHPEVPRGVRGNDVWRPLFRNEQERSFERTVEWLKAMYRPRPEYPIEYRPPRPSEAPEKEKGEPSPR